MIKEEKESWYFIITPAGESAYRLRYIDPSSNLERFLGFYSQMAEAEAALEKELFKLYRIIIPPPPPVVYLPKAVLKNFERFRPSL